jgi:transcriptional regulator with XRE-family HTH domain
MLPLKCVEEIRRLLDEGELSQRKIATRLGVSRGTVGAIASGRRGLYGRESDSESPDADLELLPAERCPRCGGRVHMPCLLCRTRDYEARQRRITSKAASHPSPRYAA